MLDTNQNPFQCSASDSTVYVTSGATRIGNTIMAFRGASISFKNMTNFGDTTAAYQYSALCLQSYNNYPDLTSAVSPVASTTSSLVSPILTDATNAYAALHPIELYTFYNVDGTRINLINSTRIV